MLKKILAGAVSLTMAAVFCAAGASAATLKKGDVNGSGNVDIEDAVGVIGYVNGTNVLEGASLRVGDVNKSGEIDIEDAVSVINSINGVNPLPESAPKPDTINTSDKIESGKFNAALEDIDANTKQVLVDAEFGDGWESAKDELGAHGLYTASDSAHVFFSTYGLKFNDASVTDVKTLAEDFSALSFEVGKHDGYVINKLKSEETTLNGLEAYKIKYHFIDLVNDIGTIYEIIVAKDNDTYIIVDFDYYDDEAEESAAVVKPVLDSLKATDTPLEELDKGYIGSASGFAVDWACNYFESAPTDPGLFYSVTSDEDVWMDFGIAQYNCTLLPYMADMDLQIAVSQNQSADYTDKSIKDIADEEFAKLRMGTEENIVSVDSEATTFQGMDAYEYKVYYSYGKYGIKEDLNISIIFVKKGDKLLMISKNIPVSLTESSADDVKSVLDSIKFVED